MRTVAFSLPKKFQQTPAKIKIVPGFNILKNYQHSDEKVLEGLAIPSFTSTPSIFISQNIFKDHQRPYLLKILIHELVHAQQYHEYGLFNTLILFPMWKIEGHASYVGENYSRDDLSEFLSSNNINNYYPFEWRRKNSESYLGSQLQAWYYLGYLKKSESDFFSSSTKLAPWGKILEAWYSAGDTT